MQTRYLLLLDQVLKKQPFFTPLSKLGVGSGIDDLYVYMLQSTLSQVFCEKSFRYSMSPKTDSFNHTALTIYIRSTATR